MKKTCFFLIILTFSMLIPNSQNISVNWLTFLGGGKNDTPKTVTVDQEGHIYILGKSGDLWGNPVHPPDDLAHNFISISKLSYDGELLWNTFLGNGNDDVVDILVDQSGYIYISGSSAGIWGSPIVSPEQDRNGWVAKLSSKGHLKWNTFIPGRGKLFLEDINNISVVGFEGFLTKLSNQGVLLDEREFFNTDSFTYRDITMDNIGNYYILGDANTDIIIKKISASGFVDWSSLIKNRRQYARSVVVDNIGNVLITGQVWWETSAGHSGNYPDIMVSKISGTGELLWNRFFGSRRADRAAKILTDKSGNIYVAGSSEDTWGNPINLHNVGLEWDMTFLKISPDGKLLWNTFFGGTEEEFCDDMVIDEHGNIFLTGYSDGDWGNPIRNFSKYQDIFLLSIFDE